MGSKSFSAAVAPGATTGVGDVPFDRDGECTRGVAEAWIWISSSSKSFAAAGGGFRLATAETVLGCVVCGLTMGPVFARDAV